MILIVAINAIGIGMLFPRGFKVDKRIEVGHDLVDGAADAASKAKDTVKSATSGNNYFYAHILCIY